MSKQTGDKTLPKKLLTFGAKRFKQTIKSHKEVLDKYYAGFEEASKLGGDLKIFLDTNVILRIYSTSFKAREKLLKFFKDYKDRIVLTSQVQWEYVKNRENVINTFSTDVTTTIPTDFKKLVVNSLIKFKNDSKSTLVDYPEIWNDLEKIEEQVNSLYDRIEKETNEKNVSTNDIIYKDEFVKVFQDFTLIEVLEDNDLNCIKSEYDKFIKEINKSESEKELFKVFPGCFEKSDKADDPFGDYIIYSEMLNYAFTNSCSIIFLTHDIKKGDWMQKNKSPHLHYVENFYQNTNQLIYILDAERILDQLLDISFKSLIQDQGVGKAHSYFDEMEFFIQHTPSFENIPIRDSQSAYDELNKFGVTTMDDFRKLIINTERFIPEIVKVYPEIGVLAIIRSLLFISGHDNIANAFAKSQDFLELKQMREVYELF